MSAPLPGPQTPTLAAAVETLNLQVTADTVLQARAAVLGEAQRLRDAMKFHGEGLSVERCGGDPVSGDAAAAFTERIKSIVEGCDAYVHNLEHAGYELGQIAINYGYTDGDIASSFAR